MRDLYTQIDGVVKLKGVYAPAECESMMVILRSIGIKCWATTAY